MKANEKAVKMLEELILKNQYETLREITIDSLRFIQEYSKGSYHLYTAFIKERLKEQGVPIEVIDNWIRESEDQKN